MKTFSKSPTGQEIKREILCPLCGSLNYKPDLFCGDFEFSRCQNCTLLMQNPQPVSADIHTRYDDEYASYEIQNEELFFKLMVLGLKDLGFWKQSFDNNAKFVDVGCATGKLVGHMQDLGWQASGVEICKPAALYGIATRKVPISIGTLEEASLSSSSIDVLHCSHLIEHLNQPDEFVKEVRRVLKPGGFFICVTPNEKGFQAQLFKEKWRSAIADHLFLFSLKTLQSLLIKNGFSVKKRKTWGGLAQGMAPQPLKKVADKFAKLTGTGDVMIILASKS